MAVIGMGAAADSDRAWRRWGETDPYYGVLSDDRFRSTSLAQNREAFWAVGDAYVQHRLAVLDGLGAPVARGRALEFGSGVGRLSLPLAGLFAQVVGLDVSPAMLAEAQRNAAAGGHANVAFLPSDDRLGAVAEPADFLLSSLVFQHIPVARGMAILPRLLDLVEIGGGASLQICVDRGDDAAQAARYWAQRHVPGFNALLNLMRGRPAGEPLMQMNAYPLGTVLGIAQTLGFGPALVQTHYHGRFLTAEIAMRRHTRATLPGPA